MATLKIRSRDIPSVYSFLHLFTYLLILSISFHGPKPWALEANQAWVWQPLGPGGEGYRCLQTPSSRGSPSRGLC